jgi:bifunctional NMN adenylyltransferase/nudix hydrolase
MSLYEASIFIGRFQPFHKGHFYIAKKALEISDNLLIICGSVGLPRSLKNPWSFEERKEIIRSYFGLDKVSIWSNGTEIRSDLLSKAEKFILKGDFAGKAIYLLPLPDEDDDIKWSQLLKELISELAKAEDFSESNFALVGHHKDESSYYLDLFPEYHLVKLNNYKNINATDIRKLLLCQGLEQGLKFLDETKLVAEDAKPVIRKTIKEIMKCQAISS